MEVNEQIVIMNKLILRCWADEGFKQRFIADPEAVMKEAGLKIPDGMEYKVVENTDKVNYVVLPLKPDMLSDEQLEEITGGQATRVLREWNKSEWDALNRNR